ncbi:MAG TPA: hypothetical protein VFG11_08965 [Acidobacteriota bacterium]|nr:hypothetical protein [Acidobacteriota bacterium]
MGKLLTLRSIVIANLQSPREKIWGLLLSINAHGITIRGIDINSYQDWIRAVANQTEGIGLTTMFIPMIRVEKVILDETVGGYKSLSEQFTDRIGRDVQEFFEVSEEDIDRVDL